MKKIFFILAPLALVFSFAFVTSETLPIGARLPMADYQMANVKTGYFTSVKQEARENGVLVMFSSNNCLAVEKIKSRTLDAAEFAQKNNIGVVFVNSNEAQRNGTESYDAMKAYFNANKYDWSYVLDAKNALANAFGANFTPEIFLFDKNMTLVYHGAIDNNLNESGAVTHKHLLEALSAVSANKPVSVTESPVTGCAINRLMSD